MAQRSNPAVIIADANRKSEATTALDLGTELALQSIQVLSSTPMAVPLARPAELCRCGMLDVMLMISQLVEHGSIVLTPDVFKMCELLGNKTIHNALRAVS